MSPQYLKKADEILRQFGISVNNISTKQEILKSKSFCATLKPTLNKIIIKE